MNDKYDENLTRTISILCKFAKETLNIKAIFITTSNYVFVPGFIFTNFKNTEEAYLSVMRQLLLNIKYSKNKKNINDLNTGLKILKKLELDHSIWDSYINKKMREE